VGRGLGRLADSRRAIAPMLPAHVRGPESAVFWILAWFDRLGEAYAPDDPVQVFQDATGAIVRIRVEGVVTFDDGQAWRSPWSWIGNSGAGGRSSTGSTRPAPEPGAGITTRNGVAPTTAMIRLVSRPNPPTRRRSSRSRRRSTHERGRPRSPLPMVAPLGNDE
jgi:hypothetical protein